MSALVAVVMGSTSDEERMAGCGEGAKEREA